MLVIHWSKHNNTSDIIKNGIRPKKRKLDQNEIKGVWCFPFSRNKSMNNNWKRNLKSWRNDLTNFNGFVFKLEDSDFPIYAGEFALVGSYPEFHYFENMKLFLENYGDRFSPQKLSMEINSDSMKEGWLDYTDFEIIITKRIESSRIVKILMDRNSSK